MALIYLKQIDINSFYALWKIEESENELQKELLLNKYEQQFLKAIKSSKRRLEWLSARVLIRMMLQTTAYIDCRIDEHGKPFMVNFPYHISISHSNNYVAVILSKKKEVGIDIERITYKIALLVSKFLSSKESSFISLDDNRILHLHICWCAKEAIYKLWGKRGISLSKNILIKPFICQEKGSLKAYLVKEGTTKAFIVNFEKFEDYMIAYSN